jgi:hypothetical protein
MEYLISLMFKFDFLTERDCKIFKIARDVVIEKSSLEQAIVFKYLEVAL